MGVMQNKVASQKERLMSLSEQCQSLELRLHELENAQKVDSSNGMVPTWFDDRHGSEAESEIQLDFVKAKRKKRRGRRNRAAVGKHTEFEQQVLMDAFDEVGEAPRDADVAMDQMLVGCTSAVMGPGEQDRTSNADMPDDLDGTRWSSTDEGGWRKHTGWYTPKRTDRTATVDAKGNGWGPDLGQKQWYRHSWNRHGWKTGWGRRWYGGHSGFGSWANRCKHRQVPFSEEGWQHQWRSREQPGTMMHVWIKGPEPWRRRGRASVNDVFVYQEGPLLRLSLP